LVIANAVRHLSCVAGVPIGPCAFAFFADKIHNNDHGYLSYQHHIVLGLDGVNLLVRTAPSPSWTHSFSALPPISTLPAFAAKVSSYLYFSPALEKYTWHEEARFAASPELAMCLRWGLAHALLVS
jgi:hypothetical protein